MITSGLGFYNASVILRAATVELDASVTAVSGATALFFGIGGIASFVASPFIDRFDIRWFYLLGGVSGAAALAGLRIVDSVAQLYVFFALFGIGFAFAGLVPGTTVVARWFHVKRSIALSIATTGLSLGGIALTPIAARLIEDRTLAEAGPLLALAWLVVIPLSMALIRSWPAERGLLPDGAIADVVNDDVVHDEVMDGEVADGDQPVEVAEGATFAEARSTRFFKLLSVTYALVYLAQVGGLAQLFNLVSERLDTDAATLVLSTMAFASVAGRLLGGVIVIRVDTKLLTSILIVVQAAALGWLALAETRELLLAGSVIFGLSVGNLLMLQPLLLAETFSVRDYSQIYSYNQLFGTIGVAGGPFLIGFIRDLADYRVALLVGAAANLVALAVFTAAGTIATARATWQ